MEDAPNAGLELFSGSAGRIGDWASGLPSLDRDRRILDQVVVCGKY